jgi:hypothetical protein
MGRFEEHTTQELEALREEVAARLAATPRFAPGTFQQEWGRCGKANCHCHNEGDPGHGPRYSIMRYESGRAVKRKVPAHLADQAKAQTGVWDAFRSDCAELADIDAELTKRWLDGEAVEAPPGGEAEKGGSGTRTSTASRSS